MKANASKIDLGGGTNGYLVLVLTPVEYMHAHRTPCAKPVHPGTIVIIVGTTQHGINRLRVDHKETIRAFRELLGIKKALVKKIVVSVEGKYIDVLQSSVTNTITANVHTILEPLFQAYDYVTPEVLAENAVAVKNIQHITEEPLVMIYNAIEDLKL